MYVGGAYASSITQDQPTRAAARDHVSSFSRTTIIFFCICMRAIDVFVRKKVVERGDGQDVGDAVDYQDTAWR